MKKVYCNFCDLEITNDKEIGKLFQVQEKILFLPKQRQTFPTSNIAFEKQEFDLCKNCLKKVFEALKK